MISCFRYHKGTDFQANHNPCYFCTCRYKVVLDTTKVQIFKQITTIQLECPITCQLFQIPQRYRFSSKSQQVVDRLNNPKVVLDTTKVQIFKQITTTILSFHIQVWLFQIPQRYRFSSKSQLGCLIPSSQSCCFRYHKGTDFQANHNIDGLEDDNFNVVLDTTKVQIFKQITTESGSFGNNDLLFQIPQRYRFSSKSQHVSCSTW